ncbi:hypothetical protein [Citrobacter youngae]
MRNDKNYRLSASQWRYRGAVGSLVVVCVCARVARLRRDGGGV